MITATCCMLHMIEPHCNCNDFVSITKNLVNAKHLVASKLSADGKLLVVRKTFSRY